MNKMASQILEGLTLENQIGREIQKCLNSQKEETIVTECESAKHGFDFFLPKGCNILSWPKETYVEIKIRLIYDSLYRMKLKLNNQEDIKKLVVIVKEDNAYLKQVQSHNEKKHLNSYQSIQDKSNDHIIEDDRIQVISYGEFIKTIESKEKEIAAFANSSKEDFISQDIILQKAKNALKYRNVTFFLGAGVSASAGVGTWDKLLSYLSKGKKISSLRGVAENIVKGRYIIDMYENDFNKVSTKIENFLYKHAHHSKLIESISQVILHHDIESVITYNYDNLLEDCLSKKSKNVGFPIYSQSRILNGFKTPIYHVHGYLPKQGNAKTEIVLGEKEYHESYQEHNNWSNVEQLHALNRNTCFFIGLSMTDPNLRRLLDLSVKEGSEVDNVHFVFLIENPKKKMYKPFMERIMRDFGINCIWYKNHNDLPKLIDSLIQ